MAVCAVIDRSQATGSRDADHPAAAPPRLGRPQLRVLKGRSDRIALVKAWLGLDFDAPPIGAAKRLEALGSAATAEEAELLRKSIEYAANSLAPNTRATYAEGALRYIAFLQHLGYPVALSEDDSITVGMYLSWMAGMGRRWSTIYNRLNALNRLYALDGLPAPGQHPHVKQVAHGIENALAAADGGPHHKDGLTEPLLEKVLVAIDERSRRHQDAVLLTLRIANLTPTEIAALMVEWVTIDRDRLTIRMPARGRGVRGDAVIELTRTGGPLCPVSAVERLLPMCTSPGPLLRRGVGLRGFTPQALSRRLHCVASSSPAGAVVDFDRMSVEDLEEIVVHATRPSLLDVRDKAQLTVGFATGMRGSNHEIACWKHATIHPDRVDLDLAWSKTDRKADGHAVPLPITDDVTSPGAALLAWRDRVASEIGGDPLEIARDMPLFPAIQSAGSTFKQPLRAVSCDDVSWIVKRRAHDAGLKGDFGSHSLRSGLVTTLIAKGVDHAHIAQIVDWKSTAMVQRYDRTYAVLMKVMRALWPGRGQAESGE